MMMGVISFIEKIDIAIEKKRTEISIITSIIAFINVKQVINVSQIFSKKMIKDKIKGSIVNVSSQVS